MWIEILATILGLKLWICSIRNQSINQSINADDYSDYHWWWILIIFCLLIVVAIGGNRDQLNDSNAVVVAVVVVAVVMACLFGCFKIKDVTLPSTPGSNSESNRVSQSTPAKVFFSCCIFNYFYLNFLCVIWFWFCLIHVKVTKVLDIAN